jgi:hypothetical protein
MTVAPPVKRDCVCPKAQHAHGTVQAYVMDRCRCADCRAANALRKSKSHRRIAYGRKAPASVPGIGTRRRLQALATKGWSLRYISQLMGVSLDRAWQLAVGMDGENVSVANAERVARVYEELWNKEAPRRTKGERVVYVRTVNRARQNGWAPPAAWDDIDDPEEQPQGLEGYRKPSQDELMDEIAVLRSFGESEERIAQRLGLSQSYVRGLMPRRRAS